MSISERASGYVRSTPFPLTSLEQLKWLNPPFAIAQVLAQLILVVVLACLWSLCMLFNA